MFKNIPLRVGAVVLAVLSVLTFGLMGGVASAHHPEITVTTDCGDDGWTVTYTVRSDAVRGLTWNVNGVGSKPDSETFVFIENLDFSTVSDSFTATATWSNGAGPESRSASASRPQGCEAPETTTTTSSTTTTIPVDPCSWPAVRTNDAECITFNLTPVCGSISGTTSGSITNQPTWQYAVWFSLDTPTNPADGTPGTLSFEEDLNGGLVSVYFWVAGTENDVLKTGPRWQSPGVMLVSTDCEEPEETTTTTETPTTTQPQTTTTVVGEEEPTTTLPPATTQPPSTDPELTCDDLWELSGTDWVFESVGVLAPGEYVLEGWFEATGSDDPLDPDGDGRVCLREFPYVVPTPNQPDWMTSGEYELVQTK